MTIFIDKYIRLAEAKNFTTPIYGISRSIIAFALLITLIFNSTSTLFDSDKLKGLSAISEVGFNKYTIFNLLASHLIIAKTICILILLFVLSGFLPQVSGILHWWITYSFVTNGISVDGGDQIAPILLLFILPFCLLDKRLNHWYTPPKMFNSSQVSQQILFFTYFLIQLQVTIIYFHAAIAKLEVEEWVNGTVLWYWTKEPMLGPSGIVYDFLHLVFSNEFLLPLATWGALATELFIAASILLGTRRIKKTALSIGIIFHFFIFLFFGLPSFALIMIAALILVLHPLQNKFKINKYEI